MRDRDFYSRDRDRNRDWERDDRASERAGDRGWDRERDRWNERYAASREYGKDDWENRRGEAMHGGEWGRESRYENQTRGPHFGREQDDWRARSEDRSRDRSGSYDREYMDRFENYPRGASGSEGGYGRESSYGRSADLSPRGGGTGIRNTDFRSVRSRERDLRGDYSYGGGMGGGMSSASYSEHWGGGVPVGVLGGMGTYSQRSEYREPGRFAGRGPKNWRRSDDRIRDDINERLTANPDIDASEIEVQVKECEVTLSGSVDHRNAKRIAEDIAENVSGVKDVHNHIRVQRSGWLDRGDRDREEGLGSGFTSLGVNKPSEQQREGQQTGQQNQYAGTGQHSGPGQNRR